MENNVSIGELARSTGLSVSAIRFYADRELLTPVHVEPSNGYRSFSPEQRTTAMLIKDLRQVGLSLGEVKDALAMERSDIARLVERHASRLEEHVTRARCVASEFASSVAVVRGSDVCMAIDQVLPFVPTHTELPHLLTVRIEAKNGSVRFVATDSHRLAVRDLVPVQLDGEFTCLVAATTLAKIRAELEPTGEITVHTADATLFLTHASGTAEGPLVPATFPDYEPFLIPREHVAAFVTPKDDLIARLEKVDDQASVRLSGSNGVLDIEVETLDNTATGVFINPALGLDCVAGAIGSEVVVELADDRLEPVVFRSATNGTYTSLLMPVRVDPPQR